MSQDTGAGFIGFGSGVTRFKAGLQGGLKLVAFVRATVIFTEKGSSSLLKIREETSPLFLFHNSFALLKYIYIFIYKYVKR